MYMHMHDTSTCVLEVSYGIVSVTSAVVGITGGAGRGGMNDGDSVVLRRETVAALARTDG